LTPELTVDGQKFTLIDTAGIRRKGKTTEMAEKLSGELWRAKSLERADVAILLIDATEGFANTTRTSPVTRSIRAAR
jgi:GTP-binding protein